MEASIGQEAVSMAEPIAGSLIGDPTRPCVGLDLGCFPPTPA
jgi:hypothetical protein